MSSFTPLSAAYGVLWNVPVEESKRLRQRDTDLAVFETATPAPKKSFKAVPLPPVFWLNKNAWEYYRIVSPILGNSDETETAAGGMARWLPSKTKIEIFGQKNIFLKHELRDQNIFVKCPYPHYEFFYSFLKYTLNPGNINKVISINPSITYDPVRSELCSRGGNLGYNIALLNLAIKVDQGIYDINHIKREGLFSDFIDKSKNPMIILEMYRELTHMVPDISQEKNFSSQSSRISHGGGGIDNHPSIAATKFYTHTPEGFGSYM